MPKVIHTNAKGLVQSTGSGFKAFDFLSGNQDNFAGSAVTVTAAEARNASGGSAAQILLATLADDAMNETGYNAQTGAGAIYLPAANAGAYLGLKFTAAMHANAQDLVIHASGAAQSASEAARQAAGGTAAVFAKAIILGHPRGATAGQTSSGAHVKITLDLHNSNSFLDQNAALYFFCPEDGKWLIKFEGSAGSSAGATFG